MPNDFSEKLCLSNLGSGQLERDFQSAYVEVLESLKHGQKGNIKIDIEIKRVPDTQTMVSLTHSLKMTKPVEKKSSVCQVTGDNKLNTDKPLEPVDNISFFDKKEAK